MKNKLNSLQILPVIGALGCAVIGELFGLNGVWIGGVFGFFLGIFLAYKSKST